MMHFAAVIPPATVPVWVAIVAAGIGATGAVAAQIVSGIVASRRERARLDFDRSRSLTQDQMAREAAFREIRRLAFVELLNNVRERKQPFQVVVNQWLRDKDHADIADYIESDDERSERSTALLRDLDLIAPGVHPAARAVVESLDAFQLKVSTFETEEDFFAFQGDLWEKEATLRDEMRRSLGVTK